ncbi:MAG TPA: hypothetical protein VHM16_09245 [Rubrobacteraceae bacterium]|nr:hypothetical protein [Rubrobacteraceae bacterium]
MGARVLGSLDGEILGTPETVRDRFMVGVEEAFREMHALGDDLDPATMSGIAARYGVEVDFERTMPVIGRHGLVF